MRTTEPPSPPSVPHAGVAVAWHALPVEEVARLLGTDLARGLTHETVTDRLAHDGPNLLRESARQGPWRILLRQFANIMVAVLLGAAVLAGVIGELLDTIAIMAILLLNAVLGFVQEHRAERAVAALGRLAAPQARVRREGRSLTVDATTLVRGDVVRLEAGDIVAADLRLTELAQLRIAEAILTGESAGSEKGLEPAARDAPLGDRRPMAFKGTTVEAGRATGVVVATGMETEIGRIAQLLGEAEAARSPLQDRLDRFTKRLALVVVTICGVLFAIGLLRGEAPGLMFLTALSLAVAAIPEALPAVVTVSLALGARRAATVNALIRRLPAVETLGSVTYICTDKTGTLTENRMRVIAVRTPAALHPMADVPRPASATPAFWTVLALCNDVEEGPSGEMVGDPTEAALVEAARAAGVPRAGAAMERPRVAELPFSSERGLMTTIHRRGDHFEVLAKGAPERLIALCTAVAGDPGGGAFDRADALAAVEQMAAAGMRVLAIARRDLPSLPSPLTASAVERDLDFLGLVGLMDPPRPEAKAAVAECRRAGIRVVMITGDHRATAQAIADQVGITEGVHARVTPEEKLRLVEALRARGESVAMTGDGVNDAPALKRADIGVAMGRSGTDVAREAADMILLDDHFATIVGAVREGRRIYDNIRKFVRYALTCNSAEIWALFLAPLIGLPLPLLPIHILWINLVTDGLPGIALGVEPGERRLMDRPPRPPSESIFARGLWQHAVWVGLLMGGTTLGLQAWTWSAGWPAWQTMAFTVLAFLQLGHLLAIRSERDPFWVGFWRNPLLLGAVLLTTLLQLAVIYLPVLNRVFLTVPLSAGELALCALVSTAGFAVVEVEKAFLRRSESRRQAEQHSTGRAPPASGIPSQH